jgi:hypothetical protein
LVQCSVSRAFVPPTALLPLSTRANSSNNHATPHHPQTPQLGALLVPSPSVYEDPAAPAASSSTPLSDACAEVAAKVRENIRLRRGFVVGAPAGGVVGGYVHMPAGPGMGRIATAVALAAPEGGALAQVGRSVRRVGRFPRLALCRLLVPCVLVDGDACPHLHTLSSETH